MHTCKAENFVVYSKSMQTLYFAIHLVVQFRADMSNTMDIALTNDIDDVSNQAPPANKEEDLASYRSCLMQREDLCQKEAYQHCSSCVGLFILTATGMKICDSCICRNRGNIDVCCGSFDYPYPGLDESGIICGEIADRRKRRSRKASAQSRNIS